MEVEWCILRNKIVFLDRDGVINVCALPHKYITSWGQFRFLPGTLDALSRLNTLGFQCIIVTNQRGISRGMFTLEELQEIHAYMCKAIVAHGGQIADIFVCPHESGKCHCRKPEIGMFEAAAKKYDIQMDQSYMIGDSKTDIIAGKRFGVNTISVGQESFGADFYCKSLSEAVEIIRRNI